MRVWHFLCGTHIEKETERIYTKLLSLDWQSCEGFTLLKLYFSLTDVLQGA